MVLWQSVGLSSGRSFYEGYALPLRDERRSPLHLTWSGTGHAVLAINLLLQMLAALMVHLSLLRTVGG